MPVTKSTTPDSPPAKTWRDFVYCDASGRPRVYGNGKWPKHGPGAIAELPGDMFVEIVNLQLRPHTIRAPTPRKHPGGGVVWEPFKIHPFETVELPVEYARKIMTRPRNNPQHATHQLETLFLMPPDGDCGGKQFLVFKDFGDKKWETCCYGNCPRHQGPGERVVDGESYPAVKHSILMAQVYLRGNGSTDAVRRFVDDFDPRYPVAALAFAHIDMLDRHHIERMGLPQASERKRKTAVG